MTDELAFPGTDVGRTVAEFDAQIKAHNAQVAAPAGHIDQTAVQWIQSHQGGYASASIYPNEVNGTVPFWLEAPAAPVAQESSWLIAADLAENSAAIREALEAFAADQTGDNAAGVVAAVLDTAPQCAAPAAPVAQPLTDEQIRDEYLRPCYASDAMYDWFEAGARFAERKHGIGLGGA